MKTLNYLRNYAKYYDFPYVQLMEKIIPTDLEMDNAREHDLHLKLVAAYNDGKKIGLSSENIQKALIIVVKSICFKTLVSENEMVFYVKDILEELKTNQLFLSEKEFESGIFSVLKRMIKYVLSLDQNIATKKYFAALKDYANIDRFLLLEGIPEDMSKEEKITELKKLFCITDNNSLPGHNARMKRKKYPDMRYLGLTDDLDFHIYSLLCETISKYFNDEMLEFYNKHQYFYRPISDDFSLYYLNGVTILAYRYEDSVSISIKVLNKYIGMQNFRYWAGVLNMQRDIYSLIYDLRLRCPNVINKKPDIICPEDYLDESFLSYLKSQLQTEDAYKLAESIGLPITSDEPPKIYQLKGDKIIKNPRLIENIKVKDLTSYETLSKLLSLTGEDRQKYIAKIIATAKGITIKEFCNRDYKPSKETNNKKAYID